MFDSTATPRPGKLSPAFVRLVDDAAIFPPGNEPLARAFPAFVRRRGHQHSDFVDTFVVSDHHLPDLRGLLPTDGSVAPVPVSIVLGAGAGAIAPAATTANRLQEVTLAGIEVALRDPDDLAANARRVVAAVDQAMDLGLMDDEVTVSVELPQMGPTSGWLNAIDELAAREMQVKFRTGGVEAHLFPDATTLGAWITAALDRETPFKCTAGLHNAVRHRDPATGFDHHGFLNVLLATRASLDGADPVELLREESPSVLAALAHEHGVEVMARTRKWFTGFGSCSVTEPFDDLHALGLLTSGPAGATSGHEESA